jgi:hypothetical protein
MSVYKIQFDQKTNNRVKISKNIKPSILYSDGTSQSVQE